MAMLNNQRVYDSPKVIPETSGPDREQKYVNISSSSSRCCNVSDGILHQLVHLLLFGFLASLAPKPNAMWPGKKHSGEVVRWIEHDVELGLHEQELAF
jgi:hypothetical protein